MGTLDTNTNNPVDSAIAGQYFVSGIQDPTEVATKAVQGTIYIRVGSLGGTIYQKLDTGVSTNWRRVSDRMWFSGTTAPSPLIGQKNDWYTNTETGDVYEKVTHESWVLRGDLTPPLGEGGITPKKFKVVVDNSLISQGYFDLIGEALADSVLVFAGSSPLIEGDHFTVEQRLDATRITLIGSVLPGQTQALEVGEILTGLYFV